MALISIKQALESSYHLLRDKDSARLEAEILLAHATGKDRVYLYTWPEQPLEEQYHAIFLELLERRRKGEPIAYITGQKEFWGLPLKVTPQTLIPRPETERLVEIALQIVPPSQAVHIADLGTGSGAIALAIAIERPLSQVHATDLSENTLTVARENATRLGLQNVSFHQGHWFEALEDKQFELIISNPPYVPSQDPHLQSGDLRYEPQSALSAGKDGLAALTQIIRGAPARLKPGGWLIVEHGYDQGVPVCHMLREYGFDKVECFTDYGSRERASMGQLPG